jgi:hypothetical protein
VSAPVSLLQGARAFARDYPRDNMPRGYLWDLADFVPTLIDTQLTGRGGWLWGSAAQSGGDFFGGVLAPFTSGEQILAGVANGTLYQVAPDSPYGLTSRGTVPVGIQNPVQLYDQTIWFNGAGAGPPSIVGPSGSGSAAPGAPNAKVGAVWREYVICAGAPGTDDTVYFSPPATAATAWDSTSQYRTAGVVTGLAALRSIALVFHAGSVERLRGTLPIHAGFTSGADIVREPLFGAVGTTEPKTICYWNENVIFADEHGVHLTDGSAIRNLASQGAISYYWRPLYDNKQSISASVFLDYYIISVVRSDNIAVTLICDLNKRQWYRFTNLAAVSMFSSSGTRGMERVWAGIKNTQRLARIGPCFFPALNGTMIADDNGLNVLPFFETPWYRLGQEGRKRVRFVYLTYDIRTGAAAADAVPSGWRRGLQLEDDGDLSGAPQAGVPGMLDVGYVLSPQDLTYTAAGQYPSTTKYTRFRLPVGKYPYGIAFRVRQLAPSTVTRIFEIGLDAHPVERGRV